jgi:hypothetical protein
MSESSQSQEMAPGGEPRSQETDEPNEFGFSGGATAPEPERTGAEDNYGESIAVPAGDLTGAITGAIEETIGEDETEDEPKKS